MLPRRSVFACFAAAVLSGSIGGAAARADDDSPAVDFATEVWPLLKDNCIACHQAGDNDTGVDLESPQGMRDSLIDDVLVAGQPEASRLYQLAAGLDEPAMPPEDNGVGARRLSEAELDVVARWIRAGAMGEPPAEDAAPAKLEPLRREVRTSFAAATSDDGRLAAVGLGNQLRVMHLPSGEVLARPAAADASGNAQPPHIDFVHAVALSADGTTLVSGGFRNFKVWKFRPLVGVDPPRPVPSDVSTAAAAGDALIAVDGEGRIVRQEGEGDPEVLAELETPADAVQLAAHPGLIVAAAGGEVVLVDGRQPQRLDAPDAPITAVAVLSADAVVAGTEAGELIRWNRDGEDWRADEPIRCSDAPLRSLHVVAANSEPDDGEATAENESDDAAEEKPAEADAPENRRILAVDTSGRIYRVGPESDARELAKLAEPPRRVAVSPRGAGLAVLESGALQAFHIAAEDAIEIDEPVSETPWDRRRADRARWTHQVAEQRLEAAKEDVESAQETLDSEDENRKEADEQAEAAKAEREKADAAAEKARAAHKAAAEKLEAAETELAELPDDEALKKAKEEAQQKVDEARKERDEKNEAAEAARAEFEEAQNAAQRIHDVVNRARAELRAAEAARDEFQQQTEATDQRRQAVEQRAEASGFGDTEIAWVGETALLRSSANGTQADDAEDDEQEAEEPTEGEAGAGRWDLWLPGAGWIGPVETLADHRLFAAGADRLWAGAADGEARRWKTAPDRWQLERVVGDPNDGGPLAHRVLALDISPDGRWLAVGGGEPSRSGQLQLWDLETGARVAEPEDAHSDTVMAVRFSRDGSTLASGGADRMIHLWQVEPERLVRTATLEGHTHHVTALDWRVDDRRLVSASADASAKIWDPLSRRQLRTIDGLPKELTAVAFVGAEDQFALVGGDGHVRIRRTRDGRQVGQFAAGEDYVYALAVDREGQRLLTGDTAGQFRLFDRSGKDLGQFQPQ